MAVRALLAAGARRSGGSVQLGAGGRVCPGVYRGVVRGTTLLGAHRYGAQQQQGASGTHSALAIHLRSGTRLFKKMKNEPRVRRFPLVRNLEK